MKNQFTAVIDEKGVSFFIVTNKGTEEHLITYPVIWMDKVRYVSTASIRFINHMVTDGWEFLPIDNTKPEGED